MMINHVLFILLLVVLVIVNTTSGSSHSHQLVAAEGVIMNKKCIEQDRHSLLHFKSHLQDPKGSLSTWTTEEEEEDDCCKWSGVTCNNQTGHVTELDLNSSGLEGEISPSLLNLTYLTYLDLIGNSFYGTIPMSIGSLTELRYLDLSRNSFNGTIPRSIGSLTELRSLNLYYNSFTGTIPRSIGSLTKLRFLELSGNSFTGTIPPEFGNLTNLEVLSIRGDFGSLAIENLDWLSHLSCLQWLNMDGISLAKANNWVNVILSLQKLSYLSLRGCDLSQVMHPYSSSSSLNSSSSSSSIATLDLRNNHLNSSMYHWLFPLTSNTLDTLDLSYNMLDGIPKYLGNLCTLAYFDLSNNSVAISFSDFLNNLSGCTSLTVQELDLSYNQFTGSLSDENQQFSSLTSLHLSHNQLNGSISEKVWELPNLISLNLSSNQLNGSISENVWELPKLQYLDLSSNSLRGPISQNIEKSKIVFIDLSNNSLEGVPSKAHMSNNYHVHEIDLSSCKLLGPHFPKWIQKLKNLTSLDIANTGISDTIPVDFWDTWPSRLTYLNLSSNNINGKVPDLLSNFDPRFSRIDLSSNDFYGPIPNVPSTLVMLDLSRNNFSGGISFLCEIVNGSLASLDLSNNSLSGQIPDCLWHFKNLKIFNIGHNYLSGRLPASVKFMIGLEALYLNNNEFFGEFPSLLKKCPKLTFLDLGANKFFGNVPVWIGENLSELYALSLASNDFFGTIPLQLCQLINLQILDLSMNKLNGTIPSCVGNLTAMVQDGFSLNQKVHIYQWLEKSLRSNISRSEYFDHAMIKWNGNVREFSSTLGLVKIIDLSSNSLTGQIPPEFANLCQLLALNLSSNALQGEIPRKIGEIKQLLTLDLSNNNLTGELPSSMSLMTSLGYLDVSHNNLWGRIPSGTQLQSFEPSRYNGNAGLCGLPLTKYCPGDEEFQVPPLIEEGVDELWKWFYIGGATGFPIGFWTVCSALLLNRRGRHAFFLFLDSLNDWVYVKVKLWCSK